MHRKDSENKNLNTAHSNNKNDLITIFQKHNLYVRPISDAKHIVICPFRENHSSDTDEQSSTVIFTSPEYGFKCLHNSCKENTINRL